MRVHFTKSPLTISEMRTNLAQIVKGVDIIMQDIGFQRYQAERLDETELCLRKAVAIKPDQPGAHSNLGNALQQQGRLDEAVACYRRAIAIKPDHPDAHNNLGKALQEQEHLDEAV